MDIEYTNLQGIIRCIVINDTNPIKIYHVTITQESACCFCWSDFSQAQSWSCCFPQGFLLAFNVLKPVSPEPSQPPWPCFSGALPFSAGSLLVYMNLEKIWNGPRDRFSLFQNFANVCLAAAVTQTLSFPFDTVKRKMQVRRCVWGDLALFVDE